MQKGGGWVQIACKIAYVLNGRPPVLGKQTSGGLDYDACVPLRCLHKQFVIMTHVLMMRLTGLPLTSGLKSVSHMAISPWQLQPIDL